MLNDFREFRLFPSQLFSTGKSIQESKQMYYSYEILQALC